MSPNNAATHRRARALAFRSAASIQVSAHLQQEILSSHNTAIVQGIKDRRWTSTQVLQAFVTRAIASQECTNCVTEVMFEQAFERAASLDAQFSSTGSLVGPFHGLPVSVKDMLDIKGYPTTLGLTSHLDHPPASRTSAIVAALEHLGAIVPYVKTNVPQLLLSFECNNAVWGRTTNPYSAAYTSGGSSGGEAALLAFRGAAMGVGTDIGGSLRIPAGYCGIYSLKPSSVRGATWPMQGMASLGGGFEGLISVAGPMCATAEDLETAWIEVGKVFSLEGWGNEDPVAYTLRKEALEKALGVPYLPAMKPVDYGSLRPLDLAAKRGKPLRIGIYHTDGFVHTTPASYRALEETVAAARKRYSTEEIEFVHLSKTDVRGVQAMEIFVGLTSAAKYRHLTHPHLHPDPLDPTLYVPVYISRLPAVARQLLNFILYYILGERDFATLGRATGGKSAEEYFQWVRKRDVFREQWRERVWEGLELDAIVAPVQATPALPHNGAKKLSLMSISTAMYNVLDFAIACLPVTRVDAAKDSHLAPPSDVEGYDREREIWNKWNTDRELAKCSRLVKKEVYSVYDATKMEGLPVGLQVITPAGKEERALGIMRMLDEALPELKKRGGAWIDTHSGDRRVGFGTL